MRWSLNWQSPKAIPLPIVLSYLTCALVWGTGWYAIRICVGEGGYPVLQAAAWRYTIAVFTLCLAFPFIPGALQKIAGKQAIWLLVAGVLNAMAMALLYWGEQSISGGMAAVLTATSPLMLAGLTLWTKTERVTSGAFAGFCLALAGMVLIFNERLGMASNHLPAMLAVVGAAFLFALVNFTIKRTAVDGNPLVSSVLLFLSMTIFFWIAAPGESRCLTWPLPTGPTMALIYLSLGCSVLTFPVFMYLLRRSSLILVSTLSFVHPVVALLTDFFFEREFVLSATSYVGVAIMLGGILTSLPRESVGQVTHSREPSSEPCPS